MIDPTEYDIGRDVKYVPNHASDNKDHPDCEIGTITSFNDSVVFVNYGRGSTSAATNRWDLFWEHSK